MGKNRYIFYSFFIIGIIALLLCCVSVSFVVAFAEENTEEEKIDYVLDSSDVIIAVFDSQVGVYLKNPDKKLQFEFCYYDAENEETEYKFVTNGYFETIPDYAEYTLKLKVFRDEDEKYNYFEIVFDNLTKNTAEDAELITLPEGQSFVYDSTVHEYEGAVVTRNGRDAKVCDAGNYLLTMDYGGEVGSFSVPLTVEKGEVTVTAKKVNFYYDTKAPELELVINGNITEKERKELENNVLLSVPDLTDEFLPGNYEIVPTYSGEEFENFDLVLKKSSYIIKNGIFTGFVFNDLKVVYDGKEHRAEVVYDTEKWNKATIEYSMGGMKDSGKFLCSVTVSQQHYDDLILTAYTIIMDTTISTNKLDDYATVQNTEGFDPTWSLSVVKNTDTEIHDKAESVLTSSEFRRDYIVGIYDLQASDGTGSFTLSGDLTVKMHINGIDSPTKLKLFRYCDGEITEIEYTFSDGCFVFESNGTDGLIVVGEEKIPQAKSKIILYCSIFGIGIIIVLVYVICELQANKKRKKYFRKKHSRWA